MLSTLPSINSLFKKSQAAFEVAVRRKVPVKCRPVSRAESLQDRAACAAPLPLFGTTLGPLGLRRSATFSTDCQVRGLHSIYLSIRST